MTVVQQEAAVASGHLVPPRLLQGSPPSAVITSPGGTFSYRVLVDTTGRARPATLDLRGTYPRELRESLQRWLPRARFAPGMLDGVPVAAWFIVRTP